MSRSHAGNALFRRLPAGGAAEQADVIILNSCTVTGTSDQKVRQTLHRLRRKNRDAVLVLTGCMPQAFPEEAAVLETADIVLGNARRREVSKKIQEFLSIHQRIVDIPAMLPEKI